METVNLKIVYNHKNKYETYTVTKQSPVSLMLKKIEVRARHWYKELEQMGRAAGIAIRN